MCDWNVAFRLYLAEKNLSNATETSTSPTANISSPTATIGKLQQQTTTTLKLVFSFTYQKKDSELFLADCSYLNT